jgi:uncharacterized protein YjiS (DUF1127 family)
MKNIHSIDTDSFALTGASVSPANTQTTFIDFPSDLKVMRMVAESHAARNRYVASLIASAFKAVTGKIAQWHRTRTTRRALTELDSRLLRDIGLERADIEGYAVKSKPGFVARGFAVVAKAVANWNTARQTRSALHRLSDAQLNDIGLTRYDIDVLAREIRDGRLATPATVTMAAAVETPKIKPVMKVVYPTNSNHVSSWFISPRRAA